MQEWGSAYTRDGLYASIYGIRFWRYINLYVCTYVTVVVDGSFGHEQIMRGKLVNDVGSASASREKSGELAANSSLAVSPLKP